MSSATALKDPDTHGFEHRLDARIESLRADLTLLYGPTYDVEALVERAIELARAGLAARPPALRALDAARAADPNWFKSPDMIGYTTYVDRFAGTLEGVRQRADYLQDLGVTYLHLLPLLDMRPGENDGGFAVQHYEKVDPRLGTISDLAHLADELRGRGISLCIDLVCNHVADTHEWAVRARAGDPAARAFFHVFPDRTLPDQFETTVPAIFAETAPGNFTFVPELDGWVWTTFYPYQWDLNYSNPEVLLAMSATMLRLANLGVDAFRLDAAPFMWKRLGTTCQNLPEVHAVIRVMRALVDIAAPGVLLKAEAIVPSQELIRYVGGGDAPRPECQLAYNTVLMSLLWSGLVNETAARVRAVMSAMPAMPDGATWLTYVRCHDDIGWGPLLGEPAVPEAEDWLSFVRRAAQSLGGIGDNAIGEGRPCQTGGDVEAVHGTSGTTASICGLGLALRSEDPAALDLALARMELVYAVIMAFGGIPLINMGDEIALLNDDHFASRPSHDGDGRWLHRVPMDWDIALGARPQTPAGRARAQLRRLVTLRRAMAPLSGDAHFIDVGDPAVLAFERDDGARRLVFLANFANASRRVRAPAPGLVLPDGTPIGSAIELAPLGTAWLRPQAQRRDN